MASYAKFINMQLIITGTASRSWLEPSLLLAEALNRDAQDRFRQKVDEIFGKTNNEITLNESFSNNLSSEQIRQKWLGSFDIPNKPCVLTDFRACWFGRSLFEGAAKLQVLAFYTAPENYLANLSGQSNPLQALEVWKATARHLIDLVRSHRSKITLFSAEECSASAEPFKNLLRQKYSIDAWQIPNQPVVDAVRLALGKMLSESDSQVASLLDELDAASHPLEGDAPPRCNANELSKMAWENIASGSEVSRKEAEEENELLLLQLHQVQEELEHYFLENRRLEKERLGASGFGACLLNAEGLRMGHCHDARPHRHLDFTLEQASLGERDLGSIRLRLVEHNGRPGLLVFQGHSPESAPLYHWKSSGEENGSPFMLIVPQDDSGRDALVAAPTSDLLFLRESARLLAGELHAAIPHGSAQRKQEWASIAKRFIDLADDIPPRLHYDDVLAHVSDRETRHFTLRNPWSADSGLIRSLEFQWKNFTIKLLPPADNELPLTNWPLDEKTGTPISLNLDLSPRSDWAQNRKAWSRLTANDRAILLLLIAELPNFAHHLAAQNPELKLDQGALRKQAKAMLSLARGLASVRKPRRLFGIIPV